MDSQLTIWSKYETLLNVLGSAELCDALARAMDSVELESNCDFIARMYDINFDEVL